MQWSLFIWTMKAWLLNIGSSHCIKIFLDVRFVHALSRIIWTQKCHFVLLVMASPWFDAYDILHVYIETEMLSFWRKNSHRLHWKVSFGQLSVHPVIKISSKWWHFRFSISVMRYTWTLHLNVWCVTFGSSCVTRYTHRPLQLIEFFGHTIHLYLWYVKVSMCYTCVCDQSGSHANKDQQQCPPPPPPPPPLLWWSTLELLMWHQGWLQMGL